MINKKSSPRLSILIIAIGLLVGSRCSLNRIVMNSVSGFMADGIEVVYQEEDLILAEQFLANSLKMIEIMIARDPTNPRLNLIAAQGFGAYANAFVEAQNPDRAGKLYQRGLQYAFAALPEKKAFAADIQPRALESHLAVFSEEDVPVLFWLGFDWGSYIMQHLDDPRMLVDLSKVEMIMRRVLELDETYNFAGVHLFYGTYYTARPPILGGNPAKGYEHFKRNLELTNGQFYMTKYYIARYYAPQVQNRQLFDELLTEIINLDLDKYPEVKLMNSLAQQKAKKLLENRHKYW